MSEKILMTAEGLLELKKEYEKLKVELPHVLDQVQEARSLGDLRENGMYSAMKEKQAIVQGRIMELEEIIKNADVVEAPRGKANEVYLGAKVTLISEKNKVVYHLVGSEEVDLTKGKISHESPLGSSLMGKKLNEIIEFKAPIGVLKYKISSIE